MPRLAPGPSGTQNCPGGMAQADPHLSGRSGRADARKRQSAGTGEPAAGVGQLMRKPLNGVRVLEVAQFTYVPSAGAVLAEWGAEVVKIEHPVTGDAQRGLVKVLGAAASKPGSTFAPIMEAPNRGKRSVGMALDDTDVRPEFDELIRRSDVFLTNYLPSARTKLHIDVADVRKVNSDIIYVAGSGFGMDGPDRDAGAYDATAFWARGGSADGLNPPDADQSAFMPAGAYGDNIGGMTIAGGVAAALYGPHMTGEPSVLDVSLLAVGAWTTQFSVNMAMLQPTPYWPEFCLLMGLD